MKGVARTVVVLLCWGALQRWLLAIGLILTVAGRAALASAWHPNLQPLFVLQVSFGTMLVLISPLLAGGILFRSLSAARAVALIPNGRLKLVVGAFASHLLLALFAGVALSMIGGKFTAPAPVFATAFAVLSVQFFGHYWSSQYRAGGFWLLTWILWTRLIIVAFKAGHLGDWLGTATGLSVALLVVVCAWLAFSLRFLRTRSVGVPVLDGFMIWTRSASKVSRFASDPNGAPAEIPHYTRRFATRTLLLGIPWNRSSMWQRFFWGILILVFVGIPTQLIGPADHSIANSFAWVPILVVAGPMAWAFAFTMTQRARLLWLASGLARVELFRLVESYSAQLTLIAICVAMLLTVPRFLLGVRDFSAVVQLLTLMAIPFASGAAFLYAGMSYVTGRRLAGTVIIVVCGAVWLVNIGMPLSGTIAPAPIQLTVEVMLVPVLRALALRQWRDIDWLLNRPKRLPARIA
jgi:hypothetical protein